MPVSTGADDGSDSDVCNGLLSGSGTVVGILAASGRTFHVSGIFRKYVVFAGRLFFPDTSSDHVCELPAVSDPGADLPEKKKICADVSQPDAGLSAQFLLCDRLTGSHWMVCHRHAAQRG